MEETRSLTANRNHQIRSVARALKILDVLGNAGAELALAEIAAQLGLPKSTVHGLLSTLRDFDYIEQSPFTGKYRLGIRLFELGNAVARNWDVRTVAGPYIQRLLEEIGETVHLVVLDKGEVLYIDKRECRDATLRIVSQVGMRLPAHCTGVGKVLLAHLPASEVKQIISQKGLPRFTKNTITDPKKLEEELAKIREQGYAIDNEEIMPSLRCVAAPIRDHTGKVIAAISVSGPVSRLSGEKFGRAIKSVTETALTISRDLGYRLVASGGE
ncbi:MAG: IclR family transcriptional regulator, regulon repressor [Clostridia bacterium]|nr:IclR family transcriptional regulator, regulon repressor [Clostridia bacterium]